MNMNKQESTEREHYWVVAISGELLVGAAAVQLVVWALVLTRRLCRSRYERVSADDIDERANQTEDHNPTVDSKKEAGDEDQTAERQDQAVVAKQTTPITAPGTSAADGWSVGEEWGLVSNMNSTFLAMILSAFAVYYDAVSPTSGLDWELWAIFVL